MSSLVESMSYASFERDQERKRLLSDRTSRDKSSSWSDASLGTTTVSRDLRDGDGDGIPDPSRTRKAVTMVACLFLHMSAFGMFVALGVVYVELIAYFESPRSKATLVQSVYNGFTLGGGIFFTKVLTTYDTGLIIMGAFLVATAGFCASAFAPGIEVVIVLIGGVGGLAVSNGLLGAFVVTSWMFKDNRKLALAVLTLGSTVGQTVLPYITRALIEEYQWQGTVIILGSLVFLNCVPCGLIIHFAKPYFHKGYTQNVKNTLFDPTCFTDVAFMIFIVLIIVFSATVPVEQWFVVDLSVLKGFSADNGAVLLSLNGIFGCVGRVLGAMIFRCRPSARPEIHFGYSSLTWAIGHLIIICSPSYEGMVGGMVVRGLSAGMCVAFLPGLQMDIRGLEKFPQTTAVSNCVSGISGIVGGFLGGLSYDLTGSYDVSFFLATAGNVFISVLTVVIYFIFKQRRKNKLYESI